jgi:hypothetical protein
MVQFTNCRIHRINSIWSHLEKYHDWENAVKIGKWSGKTKIAIILSKKQFRPQFWAQIVAGVETYRYSPSLGLGDQFWQCYEENQVQPVPRGALVKTAILECTHIMVSKIAFFIDARARARQRSYCSLYGGLTGCADM